MPRMIVTLTGGTSASTISHNPGCWPGPCSTPTFGPPTFTPPTLPPPATTPPPVTTPPTGYPTETPGTTYPPTTDTPPTSPPVTETPTSAPPATTTFTTEPAQPPRELPVTGDGTLATVGAGVGLLVLGAVMYAAGRKRLSRNRV